MDFLVLKKAEDNQVLNAIDKFILTFSYSVGLGHWNITHHHVHIIYAVVLGHGGELLTLTVLPNLFVFVGWWGTKRRCTVQCPHPLYVFTVLMFRGGGTLKS